MKFPRKPSVQCDRKTMDACFALSEKSLVFLRPNFIQFCMQVPKLCIITHVKSKTPHRMATLTYSHFFNPRRSNHCAHYTVVNKKHDESFPTSFGIVRNYYSNARKYRMETYLCRHMYKIKEHIKNSSNLDKRYQLREMPFNNVFTQCYLILSY